MRTTPSGSLFHGRRQKRIREQLRDGITEVREREAEVEYDKQTRSIRQYLQINEVEALLDHVDALERQVNSLRSYREVLEGLPEGTLPRV